MKKWLFARRLSRFDVICIALGAGLVVTGHWLIAVLALVVGSFLSVTGEDALIRSEAKWS